MPFGMDWNEFNRARIAAQGGDPMAAGRITAGAGLRISTGGRVALAATGVALGGAAGGAYLGRVGLGSLQPGTTPAPVLPGMGTTGPTTPDFCSLITDVRLRAACVAAAGLFGGGGSGGGGGLVSNQCPPGYVRDANGGCRISGMGSYLPGDIGAPDFVWTPVNGRYGAGVQPFAVDQPRLKCPPGYKLGKDEVCYECLAKTERKWNPGTKPFMTGGDLNAVARVRRLKKRGRKMVTTLGLNPPRARKGKRK
jgi:hypothetical protein